MHLAKPDPTIFTEALRQAGIKAEDTLFIDDREDNCQAAQSVGITALHDPEGEMWFKGKGKSEKWKILLLCGFR